MKDNVVKRIKLLYDKCVEKIGPNRTKKLLEGPDRVGNSLAFVICRDFSQDLFEWMVELDISPNTIAMGNLMTPFFRERRVVEYLLKKGVSPFVRYEDDSRPNQATIWRCQKDDFSHNFEEMGEDAISDDLREILENLMKEKRLCQCDDQSCSKPTVKHAVCFSPFDSDGYFKACFTKNESMVPFNCKKARLYGTMYDFFYHDTSMVFKTTWQGQEAVMKCRKYIPKYHQSVNEACNHLTKILAEFSAAERSNENTDGVLAPLAYFRQQYFDYEANDDELDKKFKDPAKTYDEKKKNFGVSSKVLNIDVLVYPKMDGNLRELKSSSNFQGTPDELRDISIQIINGLKFCKNHGISHNDIKPENILYKIDENNKITVKITDFGQVEKSGGTPGFASPESFSEQILSKSDIYSFGKTLLYLYTSDEVYKCLTQIPLIPDENIFKTETEMHVMLQCLKAFLEDSPLVEMVQNLLSIGKFQIIYYLVIYYGITIYM